MKKTKNAKPAKAVSKKEAAKAAAPEASDKPKKTYNVLRGMHDILPREEKYWKKFFHIAENLAEHFQFGRIETPLLEEANLFVRSVGKGTDIVEKEMYVFEDRDETKVAIRPEGTAGVVRAYIGGGMWNLTQPVNLWYFGPMFRHERPQAGRYREHFQVGFESLGAKDPAIDAELILIATNFYKDMGLPVEVHINSLGTPEDRERYINELTSYYRSKRSYLCENCRIRLTKNPLRLLDCKEEGCQPVKEGAPQIIDWLSDESKNYFMKVLEYLDELGIAYLLTPTLVRGMDYYTHTVFEIYPAFGETAIEAQVEDGTVAEEATEAKDTKSDKTDMGSQSALGGGGRYDLLVESMGGKPTPAAGFGVGMERAVAAVRQYQDVHKVPLATEPKYDVYFAQLGDDAKRLSLRIINELRGSGIRVAFNFFKNALKAQLEQANNLKVGYVIILGQKEVQDGTVIIRDMESGVQEIVDQKKLQHALERKLGKGSKE